MSLSSRIMDWVVRNAPAQRCEWAQAMRAEFEAATHGRLMWALGCLWTAAGWRLKSDAIYIMVAVVGAILVQVLLPPWLFWHMPRYDARTLSGAMIFYSTGYFPDFATVAALSLWRRDRLVTNALLVEIANLSYLYLYVFPIKLQSFGAYIHISNLPPVAGEGVYFLICLFGSIFGFVLRKGVTGLFSLRETRG